jgi:hypothetical protein
MAFLPTPGIGVNKFQQNTAMTPLSERPQQVTPNSGKRAKVISNANAYSNTSTKPSGQRTGGKTKTKRGTKSAPVPNRYAVIPDMKDRDDKRRLNITLSDFGYDIQGTNQAAKYQGKRDTTLFRDYNQQSQITTEPEIAINAITNSIKLLDIDFNQSLNFEGFKDAWNVILNMITRDIVSNTRAASGALTILPDITNYFSTVAGAFDLLIELEVIQAWSPSSNDYYDRSFRALAVAASTPEILEFRANLRQALIPHVLPHDWMTYIKWLRETKLQNATPESTKLRFHSQHGVALINGLFTSTSIQSWTDQVAAIITELNELKVQIPAVLINNVNCVQLKNVKEYYTGVHNSAVYDPDFNDVFNNRILAWEGSAGQNQYPEMGVGDPCYAAFHSATPLSIALASLYKQRGYNGVPLEGKTSWISVDDQVIKNNTFQISESAGSVFRIRGRERWYESSDDSTHIIDLSTPGILIQGMSIPKGIESVSFVADYSNIHMAARESLTAMTLANF